MKSKHSQAGFTLLELLVIIVLLAAVVLLCWAQHEHGAKSPTQSASQTVALPESRQVLALIKQRVLHDNPAVRANTAQWIAQMGTGIILASAGHAFKISSQSLPSEYFGYSAEYNPPNNDRTLFQKIDPLVKQLLTPRGYSPTNTAVSFTGISPNSSTAPVTINHALYAKGTNNCIHIYDNRQQVESLSCYTNNDISRAATIAEPYVTAYTSGQPGLQPSALTFGPVTVKSKDRAGVISASQTKGYDISEAVMTVNGSKKLALFYNKDNGAWHYVTQADDEFGFRCGTYMTNADVRAAMHGQICLSATGQIRLDSTQRATR